MHGRIVSNFKKCWSLQDQTIEAKKSHESSNSKIEKLSLKLGSLANNMKEKMTEFSENSDDRGIWSRPFSFFLLIYNPNFIEKTKIRIRDALNFERDSISQSLDKTKNLCKELIELNK